MNLLWRTIAQCCRFVFLHSHLRRETSCLRLGADDAREHSGGRFTESCKYVFLCFLISHVYCALSVSFHVCAASFGRPKLRHRLPTTNHISLEKGCLSDSKTMLSAYFLRNFQFTCVQVRLYITEAAPPQVLTVLCVFVPNARRVDIEWLSVPQ